METTSNMMSINDFIIEFENAVRAGRRRQEENEFMTMGQVEEMLHVNRTTLWRWEKNKYLCPLRIGRRVLYKRVSVISKIQDMEAL